jgi:DNA helicase II / ATP-dependent DNA helicase PcrA
MIKTLEFEQKPFENSKDTPKANVMLPKTSKDIITHNDIDSYFFRMLEEKGILLNEKQIEAVRHTEGPILTLAGAGSGKTSVLTTRVRYLINIKKIHPKNIMLLTFTVKAA